MQIRHQNQLIVHRCRAHALSSYIAVKANYLFEGFISLKGNKIKFPKQTGESIWLSEVFCVLCIRERNPGYVCKFHLLPPPHSKKCAEISSAEGISGEFSISLVCHFGFTGKIN